MTTKYKQLSRERKELVSQGLVPHWYITGGYQMFKEKYEYETNGRSVRGQFERIADTVASYLPEHLKQDGRGWFFKLLWNGWLSPSTPVLANTGTDRGMSVSCAANYIEDSIDGFYSGLREAALLTKHGFGTASYLGDIRPRGSLIAGGGKATGLVPVFKDFVTMTLNVSQSGVRRGAWAGYVPLEHGDFDELVDYIMDSPDSANVGWCISDDVVKLLNSNDFEMIRRYQRALKLKMVTGKGYYFFPDKANRHAPEMYKKHNLKIVTSQLCVAPETLILTDKGNLPIGELDGEFVNVWNGEEWSNVGIVKTGENQELVKVMLTTGQILECTPYHKFHIIEGINVIVKEARELKNGDSLLPYNSPSENYMGYAVSHIESIEYTGRMSDTYCFNEPKRHMGVFNGILTGNCSEITLHCDKDHSYTCVLSSMNLATYDEWKDTDAVYWATIFLDCVCEDFLTKARKVAGFEKAVRCTEKGRALGLGVCGLHSYMQDNNIVFESLDAQFKMCEMFELLQRESKRASQFLAKELGEPEWCKGFGLRNTHTMTCPPTKSTALLMGGVSEGISPQPGNTYSQQTASGEIDRINPSLVKIMKAKGKFTQEEIDKIVDDEGSVRNVDWLDDHEKAVFRTAFEMNQNTLLRYAAIRNRYVDQWQSVNLFLPADTPEEMISELHEDLFNDENIQAVYYLYSKSGYSHKSKMNCESCQ